MATKKVSSVLTKEVLIKENEELRRQLKERERIRKIRDSRREHEAKQREYALFNTIGDPVFIYDAVTYKFLHCNDSAVKKYGYSLKEFLTMTPFDLHKPEDFESVRANIDSREVNTPNTYTHLTKDRRQRIVEIMTEEVYFDGTPAWMSIIHDISERIAMEEELQRHRSRLEEMVYERTMEVLLANKQLKQEIQVREKAETAIRESELKFRNLIEKSLDGIILVNEIGTIIEWNEGQERIYGSLRAQVFGKKLWDVEFLHEPFEKRSDERYKKIKALWQNFFTSSDNPFENNLYVSEIEKPDGKRKDIQRLFFAIPTDKGHMMACTTRDITDQLSMEKQLAQTQKLEAMGTLAGGIAHDFNNILGGIIGYTELALRKSDNEGKVKKYLNQVMTASNRAKDLVKQILTFSRKEKRDKEPLKMGIIVKEVIKLLRSSLPASVEIVSKIENNDKFVMADPTQIHQVMMNLCTNAAHSMKDKGGILEVRLKEELVEPGLYKGLSGGAYLRLSVSDTGYGIKPELLDKIFEPFYTTKEKGEGTGMGLAVVHGIVEGHQGYISVYSKENQGTTFSILLPIIIDLVKKRESKGAPIPGGKEHILLVEDDVSLADARQKLLEELGYRVTLVKTGVEAFEIFSKVPDRFELIITDYSMPKMTGLQLAEKIRDLRPKRPIILCTGYSEVLNPHKSQTQFVDEVILKPVDLAHMANTMRRLIEGVEHAGAQ